jgi:hypothetical protein
MNIIIRRDGRYDFSKREVEPKDGRTYTEISAHGTSKIVIYGGSIGCGVIFISEPVGKLCLDVGISLVNFTGDTPEVEVKYIGTVYGKKEYAVWIDGIYLFTYTAGGGLLKIVYDRKAA